MDLTSDYQVITFSIGDTKAGTKMGKLQLKNLTDETVLNCILWEETLGRIEDKVFRAGNTVKIKSGTYNEKFNNCLVSGLELVQEAKLGLDKEQTQKYWAKLNEYIDSFKDAELKDFVKKTLSKNEELFKITPAAKAMHHNFMGGLLVHTLECVEVAETLMPKFNGKISRDELLAACILHDMGKVFEYKINTETGLIEVSEQFEKDWISHSQYGFTLCMNAGFDRIAKMIAAHHSRADWGAMIDLNQKGLEPFYYIVHHVDDISAKFGKITVNEI